jgi:hypothetical protein
MRLWRNLDDIIFIIWLSSLCSFWLGVLLLSVVAAASAFVTILFLLVLGFFTFALLLITFFFGFLLSLIVLVRDGVRVPFFSPFVLGLQLLWVVVDVEEIEVAVLVVSKLVGLRLDPGSASQLIVVQELVAENVLSLDVGDNKLSSGLTSIGEWMWTWSISVGVKQLKHDLLPLAGGTLSGLDTDEDRLVVISDVDEGLRGLVPEEQAVFSSFVSLDPEPARLELKFGIFIEDSGIAKIRSSSLSLLCNVESFVRHQEIIL